MRASNSEYHALGKALITRHIADRIRSLLLQQGLVTMQGVERAHAFGAAALQVLMKLRQGDLHVRYEVLTMPNNVSVRVRFKATSQPPNAARFAVSNRFPYRGRAKLLLILSTKHRSH